MNRNKIDPRNHIGEEHGIYKIIGMLDEKSNGQHVYIAECQVCGHKKYSHYSGISSKTKIANICNHIVLGGRYYNKIKWANRRIGNIFSGMKSRCYNENDKNYRWYGAKGIKVCDEWLDNPELFEEWATQNDYDDNLTIDRIDENKDYSPENCRWITSLNNAKYKSTTSLINIDGEIHTGKDWSKILGFGENTINKYIRKYGLDNTIIFIKRYLKSPKLKPKSKQSYYDLYMNNNDNNDINMIIS